MKKFKLLALALVIGTSSLFAATTNKLESPEKTIRTEIIELLKSPDFNIEKEFCTKVDGIITTSDFLNSEKKKLNNKQLKKKRKLLLMHITTCKEVDLVKRKKQWFERFRFVKH